MSLRILHVVRSLRPETGGPVTVVCSLTTALKACGHRSDILSLDPADRINAAPGIYVLGNHSEGYGYTPAYVPWLRTQCKNYDAVIIHGLWQFQSAGAWRALGGTKTPYIVYAHGMLDPWFKHQYPLKHIKKWLYWWPVERNALRAAKAVLFTCEEERRLAHQSFAGSSYHERVVALGIAAPPDDTPAQREAFFQREPALRDRSYWLFLGRIHPKKGVDLLIDAYARIATQNNRRPYLVIAGPCADPAYLGRLQRHALACCPANTVRWPGMLEGDAKWGALRAADAFVLPSHQENFGLAVVEALACGTPVLLSNQVNIWREIADDGAGLVEPDTTEGTCRLLERWRALDPAATRTMRTSARRSFLKRYEIGAVAHTLSMAIHEICAGRSFS